MNRLLLCGAAFGLLSVIMGALGDHAFDLSPEKAKSLATAIRYNMLYAVLVVAISLAPVSYGLKVPGIMLCAGAALFSLSIYASLLTGIPAITYLTPLGGITIMLGWAILCFRALRTNKLSG